MDGPGPPSSSPPPGGTPPGSTPVRTADPGTVAARSHRWTYVVLALLAYVPMLLTKPGVVSDDTKTYLYLDPGRWTRQAASIWDPNVALGTVTHENIGYLFPAGPYYWLMSTAHVPIWVAQRIWLGSIVFLAGAGVLLLARALGFQGPHGVGALVSASAYAFTPYVMQYAGRISVILLPYAGLPLLLFLVVRATRTPGWRYPALVALTVASISGINASSVIYVAIAPLLWLPFSVFVAREATGRHAWGVLIRTGLLSLLISLWWIVGLAVEGAFGINVLRYTESVEATSSTSNASEVIRGLGYWYFYGGDRLGLWTAAASEFTQKLELVALTYLLPIGAFLSAAFCRWRYRIFFVGLVVIGVVLSVGAYPYEHPTAFGGLVKTFMTRTTIGLAMRSTDRATPLVILGLAVLLGMGVSAVLVRLPRIGPVCGALVVVLLVLADAPAFAGRTVISQFSEPAHPPTYVAEAAAHLNSVHPGTRVYALPGENFAAYRWGDTIDPVWPAILDRPFVIREQQIQGSLPTADLLYALDAPLQEGTMDWSALAPIARLMSVGDVLVDYDQAYERYDTPRPTSLQAQLATTPPGLSAPVPFGPPTANTSTIPQLDETYYGLPTGVAPPAPIVTYTVADPRPVVRAESLDHPLVVDGDAVGLVQAAGIGMLAEDPTIFYAGTLAQNPTLAARVLHGPADLVVTDSNRRQSFEWNSLNDNTGYTQTTTEPSSPFVANDPPLDLFVGTGPSTQTTTLLGGVASVTASAYGTATTLRSGWRPANAIDGNLSTAWETEGDSGIPTGNWWQVRLTRPSSFSAVNLVQPLPVANEAGYTNQWITRATLTFDGGHPLSVDLGASSRTAAGQTVTFPARSFRTLRITIDTTNQSTGASPPPGASLVGLAEVRLGNVRATQTIEVPTDLVRATGVPSARDRLTYLFTRLRAAPVPPRTDSEVSIVRRFDVPTTRTFAVSGTARLSSQVADSVVDTQVGRDLGPSGIVRATSSSRMPGDLGATASATLDGDPATAWSPGLGDPAQVGSWLDYRFAAPTTVDHLDLGVVSDAEHSRPSQVTVSTDQGSRVVDLPPVPVTAGAGSVTTVPLTFAPLSGTDLRVTFTQVAESYTADYETSLLTALPIAISEVRFPGTATSSPPGTVPVLCRADLLRLDDRPLWVSVSGSATTALAGGGLGFTLCGPDRSGVVLGSGRHLLTAADGSTTGWDIDQVVLDSAAPSTVPVAAGVVPPTPGATEGAPTTHVVASSSTAATVRVTHLSTPSALVLGESFNKGWTATVSGGPHLPAPVLIDGFANGWVLDPRTLAPYVHDGTLTVVLHFAPQSAVNLALLISAATMAGCLAVVLVAWRRRRTTVAVSGGVDTGFEPSLTVARSAPAPGSPRRWVRVALGTVVAGAVAWALGGPLAGGAVAVAVLLAMTVRGGRILVRVAGALLMVAGALDIVVHQERYRYPPGGWPTHFDRAATLIWAAVLILGADAALECVRRIRDRGGHDADGSRGDG